ncbi:MAG TPA: YfiR family protein [Allosphingosinicella sp.]|nr:YfiR family protein [Allosphingosinicella sp.]
MAWPHAPRPRRLLRLLPAALAMLASPAPAAAPPSDVAVKAAFLTKFPAYVDWPAAARPRPGAPVQICILGGDPFGRLIDEAARGQQVDGHPLQVRRLSAPGQAAGCHVAFVQGSAPALLQGLQGKPMLTVTDARGGAQAGMIHFVIHQGRVRFNIDEALAAKSGVAISSRLLRIALAVRQRP